MTVHSAVSIEDLRRIVGADYAREGAAADAIDGVRAHFVAEPGSVEEAAELLTLAHRYRLAVVPSGAGTKMGWGNPPSRVDLIVSARRMNHILEHAAGDLVVRVQAGATLASVQQSLGERGQWLALDPPEPGATVGGIVAANASGPRRLRYGTARDLLIGLTYILPDGTVARSGGKVVKNVAGYDLGKLFTGSFGTLGLIAEATFRLHPLPAAHRLVQLRRHGDHLDVGEPVQALLHSALVPHAIEFRSDGDTTDLLTVFEGIEPGVAAQADEAMRILGPYGEVESIETPQRGRGQWPAPLYPSHPEHRETVRLKISTVPAAIPRVMSDVLEVADGRAGSALWGHAGTGITYVNLFATPDTLIAIVAGLRERVRPYGGRVVIQEASPEVKRAVDVWGPVGDALPLMRRVKEMFDPEGIMNPGRFVGGM